MHEYNREALVCSSQLKQGLFAITAIDNINHIPSSATASSSFYDTTISIFQKVTSERCKNITLKLNTDINQENFKTLPVYYTNIFPVKRGHRGSQGVKVVRVLFIDSLVLNYLVIRSFRLVKEEASENSDVL